MPYNPSEPEPEPDLYFEISMTRNLNSTWTQTQSPTWNLGSLSPTYDMVWLKKTQPLV